MGDRKSLQVKASEGQTGKPARRLETLPLHLEKRLAGYAAAAGTAGVAILALAQPANADIIFTASNQINGSFDLNHDGINDFSIVSGSRMEAASIRIFGNRIAGNSIVGLGFPSSGTAAALVPGAFIGPGANFLNANNYSIFGYPNLGLLMVGQGLTASAGSFGPFANVNDRFLGVKFEINGQAHYGWIGFTHAASVTAQAFGYAYETNANQSILAGQTSETPEPGTLGLLALGSLGLGFWRRRKQESVTSDK